MGFRTIIEINHDYLKDAAGEIADLLRALPHASEADLKEEYRFSNAIKVLRQRNSYSKITLEVE